MKILVHGEDATGEENSVYLEADTFKEVKEMAYEFVEAQGWVNYWAEAVTIE